MASRHLPPSEPMFMKQQPQLSDLAGNDRKVEIARMALKVLCSKQCPLTLTEMIDELRNQSLGEFIDYRFISKLDESELYRILRYYTNYFTLVRIPPDETEVIPHTKIELCKTHCSKNGFCKGDLMCNGLHICKFFVFGSCKIRNCKFGHDFTTKHNMQIRQEYLLDHLNEKELKYLLNLAENRSETTVPRICKFYNYQGGCRYLQQEQSCPHLHVCRYYIMGECSFGQRCKRNHDLFTPDVKELLSRYKININRTPKEIIAELREALSKDDDNKTVDSESLDQRPSSLLVSKRFISTPNLAMHKLSLYPQPDLSVNDSEQTLVVDSAGFTGGARKKSSTSGNHHCPPKEKSTPDRQMSTDSTQGTHICLYNLRGQCWFKDLCRNIHKNMPYQWQIRYQSTGVWEDLGEQDNLDVEFNFCAPQCDDCFCQDRSGFPLHIFFEKMEAELSDKKNLKVRRLSTISSEDAANQPLATRWHWFWQDLSGEWKEYGSETVAGYQANVVSNVLEQSYLANPTGQCQFATMGYQYTMDFSLMTQQNMGSKTKRRVKRRPEDVSSQRAKKRRQQQVWSGVSQRVPGAGIGINPCDVPRTWNVQQDVIDHFKKVEVMKFSREEYQKVETFFMESMPSTTSILRIERIENGELWSNYHHKKEKMKRKNPGLKELKLFHATQSQYIDAISHQGFDFRLSGRTSGTRLGKGSYFAKTARFADSYAERGEDSTMFIVSVLAGYYTKGDKTYSRPPLRDPGNPCSDLYDSCVDDVTNPKIFVIFDNCQVYPEYVIKYKSQQ